MKSLQIKSNIHDYTAHFHAELSFWDDLLALPNVVFVADKKLSEVYPTLFSRITQNDLLFIDALEENKNLDTVANVYRFLSGRKAKRNMNLVSLGGGIIQDITGFAASTMYRGIGWHFVPTTFLAQADSCVGSKTSLNFDGFKNILGGFYPPHNVHICPTFLNSLPEDDIRSGIGEVIKFLLLEDRIPVDVGQIEKLAESLWRGKSYLNAIHSSLSVKQSYIAQDEFDTGKRNLFNYGHCFGHALETASNYLVPHGQAVTIGMIFANFVSYERGLISVEFLTRLNRLMKRNLSVALCKSYFMTEKLLDAMKNDKKRVGPGLVIVMPGSDQVEAIKVVDFTEKEFSKALNKTMELLSV